MSQISRPEPPKFNTSQWIEFSVVGLLPVLSSVNDLYSAKSPILVVVVSVTVIASFSAGVPE